MVRFSYLVCHLDERYIRGWDYSRGLGLIPSLYLQHWGQGHVNAMQPCKVFGILIGTREVSPIPSLSKPPSTSILAHDIVTYEVIILTLACNKSAHTTPRTLGRVLQGICLADYLAAHAH